MKGARFTKNVANVRINTMAKPYPAKVEDEVDEAQEKAKDVG